MVVLYELKLLDILTGLPDIKPLNLKNESLESTNDLFLCALGFEDRCAWIPEKINEAGGYRAYESIYFEYETNIDDNTINKARLTSALGSFSESVRSVQCDETVFPSVFREILKHYCKNNTEPSVTFDISVCSSKLLVLVLTILFEFNLSLRILYSEAAIYHPLRKEYNKKPDSWISDEYLGTAKGVGKVIPSLEHPGNRRDRLPEAIVVFPTFKPERTRSVIIEVDLSLAINNVGDRIVWIVGVPHLKKDQWRKTAMREINKIPEDAPLYEVSTFNYKDTLEVLERIHQGYNYKYHMTISPLGSKMQSLGVALFWYMRQEVSLVFALPKEYNARQYSEGCRGVWQIDFGNIDIIKNTLDSVGQILIK